MTFYLHTGILSKAPRGSAINDAALFFAVTDLLYGIPLACAWKLGGASSPSARWLVLKRSAVIIILVKVVSQYHIFNDADSDDRCQPYKYDVAVVAESGALLLFIAEGGECDHQNDAANIEQHSLSDIKNKLRKPIVDLSVIIWSSSKFMIQQG